MEDGVVACVGEIREERGVLVIIAGGDSEEGIIDT